MCAYVVLYGLKFWINLTQARKKISVCRKKKKKRVILVKNGMKKMDSFKKSIG